MRPAVLAATLFIAGCSARAPELDPVALVTLAPVEQGAIRQTLTLYGAAEAGPDAGQTLIAPTDAIIARIDTPLGSRVNKGQMIAHLSPAPAISLDLQKAETDARTADAAYERAKRLRRDGLVSDADVETARAAASSANATRSNLQARASALVLRAPLEGDITEIRGKVGDQVQAGAVVAVVAQADKLRARFGADPKIARTLTTGRPVRIRSADGVTSVTAEVTSVGASVDPQTRLVWLYADLPAKSPFAVGETLIAEVAASEEEQALLVPYTTLLDDGGQPYLFVVTDGVAHRRDVVVGPVNHDKAAIRDGVRLGEQVIVEGGSAVDDGMKVRTR